MFLASGVEPLLVFVHIPGASALVVTCCGSLNPGMTSTFVFVSAMWITVADIVTMFGAIV